MALLCVYLDRVSGTLSMQSADEMLKMPCNALLWRLPRQLFWIVALWWVARTIPHCRRDCSAGVRTRFLWNRSQTSPTASVKCEENSSDAAWSRLSRPNLPAGTA
jgi:hypothetical protein